MEKNGKKRKKWKKWKKMEKMAFFKKIIQKKNKEINVYNSWIFL